MLIKDLLPNDLFKDKVVFITGGGSGINLGIAKNFAALGANLSIMGRTVEKLDGAAEELRALGAKVVCCPADVRVYDTVAEGVVKTKAELGPIDVAVAGAAGNFPSPAAALSPNGFKSVVDIDLLGSFNTAKATFDQLQETKGLLLFVSAGQANIPYMFQCHVGAAKAGVENLMKNLALEWGPAGIRVNSIVPGPIENTEGARRLTMPGVTREAVDALIPLGRHGTVDEIGHAAVFLATPLAAYITGAQLMVDGGQNLGGSLAMTNLALAAMNEPKA